MSRVSVLTAGGRLTTNHLIAAYESLLGQTGVAWEWTIQIDGDRRQLPTALVRDPRICVAANGSHLGIAITRNRALMRCRAEYVQNLDDDDVLAPGALVALSAALDAHPDCAFAFGDGYDTDEQGAPRTYWSAPHGVLEPGELFDRWMCEGWRTFTTPPLAPAGIMWRRTVLFAEGGWRAMSGSEDTALVMSAAEKHPCVGVDALTLGVREHPRRSTRSSELRAMKGQHWEFIRRQVLAQRSIAQPV